MTTLSERYGGGRSDGSLLLDAATWTPPATRFRSELRDALEAAIANVRRFAEAQRPAGTRIETVPGVELERRWTPLGASAATCRAAARRTRRR